MQGFLKGIPGRKNSGILLGVPRRKKTLGARGIPAQFSRNFPWKRE
jgi:hypothetical protein